MNLQFFVEAALDQNNEKLIKMLVNTLCLMADPTSCPLVGRHVCHSPRGERVGFETARVQVATVMHGVIPLVCAAPTCIAKVLLRAFPTCTHMVRLLLAMYCLCSKTADHVWLLKQLACPIAPARHVVLSRKALRFVLPATLKVLLRRPRKRQARCLPRGCVCSLC